MQTKTCGKCQETKTLDNFYKSKPEQKLSHGVDYYCKYCRSGAHLKSIRTQDKKCSIEDCNKSHYARTWCRMHYARWERNGHTDRLMGDGDKKVRDKHLRLKYLITLKEYEERTADGCELCGEKSERSYHVDHDHNCCKDQKTCGKCIRGIICHKCNIAVDKMEQGLMREDYPNYWLITKYLETYNA
jgi:hypothetical protein